MGKPDGDQNKGRRIAKERTGFKNSVSGIGPAGRIAPAISTSPVSSSSDSPASAAA